MTDAPPEALNFFDAPQESPPNILDVSTFENEDDNIPTIDILKETFEDDESPERARSPNPRRSLFILLDEPDSSALARVISVVLMLMIFSSSVSFVMETTDPVQNDPLLKGKLHVRLTPLLPVVLIPTLLGALMSLKLLCVAAVGDCMHCCIHNRVRGAPALLHRAAGGTTTNRRPLQLLLETDESGGFCGDRAVLD